MQTSQSRLVIFKIESILFSMVLRAVANLFLKVLKSLMLRPVFADVAGLSPAFTVVVGSCNPACAVTLFEPCVSSAAFIWYGTALISSSIDPPIVGTSRISLTCHENNEDCMGF